MSPERGSRLHVRTHRLVLMLLKKPSRRIPVWGMMLALAGLLAGHGGAQGVQAQSPADLSLHRHATLQKVSLQPSLHSLDRRHVRLKAPSPTKKSSVHVGDALIGSSIGTVIGGPLGVLLLRAASDDKAWEDRGDATSDECCGLQRVGMYLVGAAAVAGGGPYGAARRLDRGGASFYAASVSGELMLGGIGYLIGHTIGIDDRRVIGGLALGVPLGILGAAGGAVLEARSMAATGRSGGLRFQGNEWQVGLPDIHVRPNVGRDRAPTVRVTLLSAQIN